MPTANGYGREPTSYAAQGITISQEEYQTLRRSFSEYHALKDTLLAGGVTEDNLQILISTGLQAQGEQPDYVSVTDRSSSSSSTPPAGSPQYKPSTRATPRPARDSGEQYGTSNGRQYSHGNGYNSSYSPKSAPKSLESLNGGSSNGHQNQFSSYQGHLQDVTGRARRTVFFTGIPKDATYADLVDVVRGGALVDVWMKNSDRCASVSFINPEDAEVYFRYAKKHDIYIRDRRVEIRWREASRQFVILRNVSRQIQHDGASRILRLRNVPPAITEDRLCEDLDHIANLRVERMMRTGSEIVCNLNSVCAALFARTCLRSRANYKGVAIEFAADECAKPLPDFKESRKEARKKPVQVSRGGNRFDALFADDGGEEGGDTDGDNDELVSVSTFTQDEDDCESSWADSTSTATEGGADLGNYWE